MSDEKFTTGEWEIEEREMNIRDTHIFGFAIMTKKHRICMCETDDDRNIPQMKANAALISAAPDMYRVLERMITLTDYAELVGVFADAKAVLKKARGEE